MRYATCTEWCSRCLLKHEGKSLFSWTLKNCAGWKICQLTWHLPRRQAFFLGVVGFYERVCLLVFIHLGLFKLFCFICLAVPLLFFLIDFFRCRRSSGEWHRWWWGPSDQPGWNAGGSPYFRGCHRWGRSEYDDRISIVH